MKEYIEDFKTTLDKSFKLLNQISGTEAAYKSKPSKWSKKELIGHLIDSASNNHLRFVTALFNEDLVFNGYEQNEWVEKQNYQNADWGQLINLWRNFNLHIAHLMSNTPKDILLKKHSNHNLHEVAWQPVSQNEQTTLLFFHIDYIGHMKHHLKQILDMEI